ncbi:MAG: hypothetical protein GF401_08480 [Chitinivibrionales bacterium]|nr:hypothetical protein [Chitinivibrionales bacterium]
MRLGFISLAILICFAGVFAQKGTRWVQPRKDNVGIYKNQKRELYEKPIVTVGVNTRMQVLEEKRDHYKVRYETNVGWVEKRLVAATAKGSKTYLFEDAEVIGYLDNPTPVYIIDADDKDKDPIKLDRSFAEALRENVDKETIERQTK